MEAHRLSASGGSAGSTSTAGHGSSERDVREKNQPSEPQDDSNGHSSNPEGDAGSTAGQDGRRESTDAPHRRGEIVDDEEGDDDEEESDARNDNIIAAFPEAHFESAVAFKTAVFQFAREHGFALATRTSTKNKESGELESVLFVCDRSGQYRNVHGLTDTTRRRQVGSRRAGCEYRIFGKRQADGRWKAYSVGDGAHNHPSSTSPAAHPVYRHMTDEQQERVREMQTRGCPPREILRALRQADRTTNVLLEDVRNTVKRQRRDELDGRSPTQALLERLRAANIPAQEKLAPDGALTHLYVGAPVGPAGNLLARFHKVLLMDCTYKTNMYNMPMLEIVGVTATGASYTAAIVFMAAECVPDYEWALRQLQRDLGDAAPEVILTDRDQAFMNAVGSIFPDVAHLLCLWHVNQNVMAKAKAILRDAERTTSFLRLFHEVCASATPDVYNDALEALRTADTSEEWATTYRYIIAEWLGDPLR